MVPPPKLHRWSDFPKSIWLMCNPLSIAIAGVLIVGSLLARADGTHYLLLIPGIVLILHQLYTRYQFAHDLPRIERRGGCLEFLHQNKKTTLEPSKIRTVIEKNFLYANPWRSATTAFPGIEIHLEGLDSPLALYFSQGMERRRDEVFALLTRWLDRVNDYQLTLSTVQEEFDEDD